MENRGNITDAIPIGQVVKGLVEALERTGECVSGKTKGGEGEKGAAHSVGSTRNKDEQHPRPDDRPKAGTVKPVHIGSKGEEERKGAQEDDGEQHLSRLAHRLVVVRMVDHASILS